MSCLLVEKRNSEDDCLARFSQAHIRLYPELDGSPHLPGVMGSVEQVQPHVTVFFSHQGHLVQIPSAQVAGAVEQGTEVITLFSLEKAWEVSAAAVASGRAQAVMTAPPKMLD